MDVVQITPLVIVHQQNAHHEGLEGEGALLTENEVDTNDWPSELSPVKIKTNQSCLWFMYCECGKGHFVQLNRHRFENRQTFCKKEKEKTSERQDTESLAKKLQL